MKLKSIAVAVLLLAVSAYAGIDPQPFS